MTSTFQEYNTNESKLKFDQKKNTYFLFIRVHSTKYVECKKFDYYE